ncbi:MAG: aspartyl-tRNA amidotransferase [Candidatus Marinimicrobia bacterium]|nr:aspartyl-tRNA amidotransferase [Candidatus Neomarinimicrobiota bacterium]|tara:strand:+ start:114 stop:569 length:456 start_codon:yes stop_codon:yes gene_type:complete
MKIKMTLTETIKSNMHQAMKEREKDKVRVLRSLISKIKGKQIEKGGSLSEVEELNIIKNSVKQIKESILIYKKANRVELVEKESTELSILESYLPKMLTHQETKDLVSLAIKETGAKSMSDLGKVMPVIMKLGGGLIDGKKANIMLRELLG